ncbi:ribosomal protein bL12 [Mongoliitalea daihaiensis]|uniref:ribosomal protein bL12 n=1 Tax=Mongoliitalea daihaiensis TaxID=2782006 RepID=UPI001F305BD1|nr:ribosomal protein L7/L12 [Mongoliitalea daihaiensis]UJP64113.1 ribosomal protein L7/L12 [Mongoliitalea daihaiensis]
MKKFTFIFFILIVTFACQIDTLEDSTALYPEEEQIFEAVFLKNEQNFRVSNSEGVKLQVIRKGNPTRSQIGFRFLVDKDVYPSVSSVEIISLESNADNSNQNSINPLIATSNPSKGKVANISSQFLPSEALTDLLLGFSLVDAKGNYLDEAFFEMTITFNNRNGLNVSFQKSAATEFDVILSSAGAEKLKVVQVLQSELMISDKEAISLIEKMPVIVLARASKEEANQLKAALEAVGATVDLKRAPEGGNDNGDEGEEATEFDVILSSAGAEKLKVVQVLQSELMISDKEAISLIEKMPVVILARASKEEANQLKAALEAVGATVDLKRAPEGGNDDGDEATEFDVILSSAGAEKLKVVQVLQSELMISDKEAISLIEKMPVVVLARASKEEANQLKAALEAVGATVDLKRAPEGGNDDGDEATEFDVILSSAGAEKLKVVQVLQSELMISDKEAISLIEKMPVVVLARASKEEANQLKAALEAVGATVDLK